jgi:hypothetical protein
VFHVRGDTLRGTTTYVVGDMVIAGAALLAVRGECPQR